MDDKQQLRDLRAAVEAVIEDDHEGSEMLAILIVDRVIGPLVAELPKCNGMCLRASDVLDDLSHVVGNPVAHEHRSCPEHGDPEQVAWELDAALTEAEVDRDRARDAAVALEQENARLHQWIKETAKNAREGTP